MAAKLDRSAVDTEFRQLTALYDLGSHSHGSAQNVEQVMNFELLC